jgi:hypothetical protein
MSKDKFLTALLLRVLTSAIQTSLRVERVIPKQGSFLKGNSFRFYQTSYFNHLNAMFHQVTGGKSGYLTLTQPPIMVAVDRVCYFLLLAQFTRVSLAVRHYPKAL